MRMFSQIMLVLVLGLSYCGCNKEIDVNYDRLSMIRYYEGFIDSEEICHTRKTLNDGENSYYNDNKALLEYRISAINALYDQVGCDPVFTKFTFHEGIGKHSVPPIKYFLMLGFIIDNKDVVSDIVITFESNNGDVVKKKLKEGYKGYHKDHSIKTINLDFSSNIIPKARSPITMELFDEMGKSIGKNTSCYIPIIFGASNDK